MAQFHELVIRSCDCKQTNRVTDFVSKVRGAAVHFCVFTINTHDTIVITATFIIGDSLEIRDPGFWHVQLLRLSTDAFLALYSTTTSVTGISEILNE